MPAEVQPRNLILHSLHRKRSSSAASALLRRTRVTRRRINFQRCQTRFAWIFSGERTDSSANRPVYWKIREPGPAEDRGTDRPSAMQDHPRLSARHLGRGAGGRHASDVRIDAQGAGPTCSHNPIFITATRTGLPQVRLDAPASEHPTEIACAIVAMSARSAWADTSCLSRRRRGPHWPDRIRRPASRTKRSRHKTHLPPAVGAWVP